jgi:sRNA-binding carbon storage regulator CsrA
MLILTLSRGKQIDITLEDGRRITLLGLSGDHLHFRIGFDAPRSILIDRHKVTLRKAAAFAT